MGTLTEYLTAWGAVALCGVAILSLLVVIKQNASRVWRAITGFVKSHPFATLGIGAGAGLIASRIMRDDNDEANKIAVTTLESAVKSALPAPVLALFATVSATSAAPAPAPQPPVTFNGENYEQAVNKGLIDPGAALTAAAGGDRDAYDSDAYDARDAYDADESDFGNIGN